VVEGRFESVIYLFYSVWRGGGGREEGRMGRRDERGTYERTYST
jgi:hypothetical protein